MDNLTKGVGTGQVIDPNHILGIVNALTGKDTNNIVIKGSLSVNGSMNITGSQIISGDITSSNLTIDSTIKSDILASNKIWGNSLTINKNQSIGGNLLVTGSLILPNLSLNQNTTQFLSLSSNGLITITTGSLREENILFVEKFKFNSNLENEDSTSFLGKINNLSFMSTDIIENIKIYSRLDGAPTWLVQKNIQILQDWIDKNVTQDKIFWIKLVVDYKIYLTGKSEIFLKYSLNK